jgi:hypothetical protein
VAVSGLNVPQADLDASRLVRKGGEWEAAEVATAVRRSVRPFGVSVELVGEWVEAPSIFRSADLLPRVVSHDSDDVVRSPADGSHGLEKEPAVTLHSGLRCLHRGPEARSNPARSCGVRGNVPGRKTGLKVPSPARYASCVHVVPHGQPRLPGAGFVHR